LPPVEQQAVSTVASSEQQIRSQRLVLPQQQMTSSSHAASDTPPHIGASAAVLPSPHDIDELDYEALPTTSVKVQLLAGAIAGIAEHTIIYPIDAIKVRPLELSSC
jgi:Mitochondrial carrier protein